MLTKEVLKSFCFAMGALFSSMSFAGGTLVFCSEASPEGLDPMQLTSGTGFDAAAYTIYDRLLGFEKGGSKLVPSLAERWSVSQDGRTYTFFLRRGAQFHQTKSFKPSRTLNADDVVFSYLRMIDSKHPFRKAYPVTLPYAVDSGFVDNIERVTKVDDYTVRITLKEPDAPFLSKVAMHFAVILSKEYADQLMKQGKADQIKWNPVGTGPFMLKSYRKDAVIRYVPNKKYWSPGAVRLDGLIFAITPDPAVRLQKMKRQECHVTVYPRSTDIPAIEKDPKLTLLKREGFNIGYVAYNTQKPALSKRKVRQALDMAIDKKTILKVIYQGTGVLAKTALPPSLSASARDIKDTKYDPKRAKQLLTEAGYPGGFKVTLWAMPVQRPYNPNARRMAQLIQADWKKIGVDVSIVSYEWGEYLRRARLGEHDVILAGWTGDFADPDAFFGPLLSCRAARNGNNYSRWCDSAFDSLILNARKSSDPKERDRMYLEAQRIIKRELPWTTLAHSLTHQPVNVRVRGFKVSPFGANEFLGVSLKP